MGPGRERSRRPVYCVLPHASRARGTHPHCPLRVGPSFASRMPSCIARRRIGRIAELSGRRRQRREALAFLKSLPAHGALVRVHRGPVPLVVICDPELTHQALVDDRVFDKGGPVFERFRDVLGDGLSSCPHHAHRRLRRLAQPAFQSGRLPGYARTMTVCLEEVTGSWIPGTALDVPTEMMSVTSQVTAAALFSESLPAAERGQLIDDVKTIAGGVFRRMLLVPPLDRLPLRASVPICGHARACVTPVTWSSPSGGRTAPTTVTCSRPWSQRATRKTAAAA